MSGSSVSQIIIYAATLILTRLFSEDLFGVYILFSSSVIILKPITSLQYELSILLPKRDKDAFNLFVFSILNITIASIILALLIFVFEKQIISFLKLEKLGFFIHLIPLCSFLYSCIVSLEYWNNRMNLFKNISKGIVIKSFTMSAFQILIGISAYNFLGLVPGIIIGFLCQLLTLLVSSLKTIKSSFKYVSYKRMLFLAKKHKDIPKLNTLLSFSNQLSNELPVYLITSYFGLGYAGIYGLAIKITKAPVGIIQQAIGPVFFNKISKQYNSNESLNSTVKKTYQKLLLIGFAFFTLLFIASFFFDIIFGENWVDVGLYTRILIPWLFVGFLNVPISSIIVVLNKQKTILYYDILLFVFRFLAFYIGYNVYNSVLISLFLFSAIGVLFNTFILIYFLKISSKTRKSNFS